MSISLCCNFKKCRKPLNVQAWVTSCSHAFCSDHGLNEFLRNSSENYKCPACGTVLKEKFDVIQADLNPHDSFKSIVLAGLKPDIIMDIAMRAISFWSYQIEQETLYQENLAKHAKEKLQCKEEISTLHNKKLKAELQATKRKVATLQTEFNVKKKQHEELLVSLEEKNRKIQRLNHQLEGFKRKDLNRGRKEEETQNFNWPNVGKVIAQRSGIGDSFVFRPLPNYSSNRSVFQSPLTSKCNENVVKSSANFLFRPT